MLLFNGQEIETDPQGYLIDSQQWSEDLIPLLAEQENITLTEEHLEIIRFVRAFYLEFNTSPAIRMLVKAVSQQFGKIKEIAATYIDYSLKAQQSKQQNLPACQSP